ncbi:MAG TPA: hypothetical protein PLH72_14260 [Vicinamibacterales bacterium]|nr:hypothetical protein [Vicinamibacterales bacterium]
MPTENLYAVPDRIGGWMRIAAVPAGAATIVGCIRAQLLCFA